MQRVKIVEAKQKGKTRRSRVKYATQNELEMARLKHQETQSALQRQHDLAMMDRQMEVERIHATANLLRHGRTFCVRRERCCCRSVDKSGAEKGH